MNTKLRILLLEDREADAELVTRELRQGGIDFTVLRVETESEYRRQLQEFAPDLILADYTLPSYNGLAALAVAGRERPDVPFILVAGTLGEESAIDALQRGATDYVLKQRLSRLGPAVRRALREQEARQERQRAEAALRKSEEHYRPLFENMLNGFAYCRMLFEDGQPRDFVYLEVNNAFEALTGLKDVVGRKVSEVIPGLREADPGLFTIYGRVAMSGAPERFETFVAAMQMWFSISVYSPQKEYFAAVFEVITERKQAEVALRQSEARYRAVTQSASDAIVTADGAGTIVGWNQGAERIFGYSEAEILGRPLILVIPPRFRDRHLEGMKRVQGGGESRVIGKSVELAGLRKDGSEFPLELSLARWEVSGDSFCTGIIRDITERKQAEEALRESEERYRMLFDGLTDAVVVHGVTDDDLPGQFLAVNNVACERLGYTREELLRLTPRDIDAPESTVDLRWVTQLLRRGEQVLFEQTHLAKDGRRIPVEINAQRHQVQGRMLVFSVVRDVTERQRAEEALRESESRFRNLVETTGDFIWEVDANDVYTYVSPQIRDILGYEPAEVLGKTPFDLMPPEEAKRVAAIFTPLSKAGEPFTHLENTNLHKDGHPVVLETSGVPFIGRDGKPGGYRGIDRDITGRKQAELRIEQLNQLLLAIRETNKLIVRERDPRQLLAQACHNLVQARGYLLVWIGLAEPGSKRVVPAARAGAQTDYVDLLTVTWDESPSGLGPAGTAMRTGQPWVCHDTATDPRFAPWREAALARGYASLAATPLIHGTRVLGAVVVYSAQQGAFLDEEIGLLNELASDLALALQSIEDEQERKKAEAELQRITHLHAMVLDSVGEGIIGLDAEGRHTFVNPVAAKMLGYTAAELIGRPSHPTWHHTKSDGRVYPQEECPITAALRDGTVHQESGELFWRKDGTSFLAEFVSTPIVDHGQVVGAVVAFKDITERQQAEARLRLQSAALESAANAIEITDRDGAITWVNPAFTRLTGWSAAEIVGQNPRLLKSGRHDQAFYQTLWETILTGNIWHGELCNQRKDGSLYQTELTIAPVKDAQGRLSHFIAIQQDITEKMDLEKRMLRAQRMESVGQLAGGIAHDLNNVLSPILMGVQLLRDGKTDPESEKYRAIIETSAKRGADIIRQVLTFARGVQGERIALQSRHLVKEMVKLIGETFPKDIRVEASHPNDLWLVRGDATQIHQVLLNLCVNARDAMPHGGMLRLVAQNQVVDENQASRISDAQPGRYVTLTVSDTGTGMSPAVMDRMFEPFFTTKPQGKGTGLGLATTFGIVRSHGGFLQVTSEVGRGSQFIVFLPAVNETEIAVDKRGSELPPRGSGECILIVDDEPSIREVASRILTQHGYQVLAAEDGDKGLAQFVQHRQKIALVISDLMMPGMDGLAMSWAIRRVEPAAKIVISTGLMGGSDMGPKVEELKEMGITTFLSKPYTRQVLLAEIHKSLHPAPGEPGAGA